MTNDKPELPQPRLEPASITFDQYVEFTPEKLELRDGYLGYGGQDQVGFHDCCLNKYGVISRNPPHRYVIVGRNSRPVMYGKS
ncbi:hypothetical protein [Tolypothrix sp. VBCCA 56010]|uniref:hypothetical protein n=1 Tax=Tolypothrix sp. VBCCA 56010 TaxID=3137731 RepID=UPI003D7E2180